MNVLLGATLAKSTQMVYKRAWTLFRQFAQDLKVHFQGVDSLPLNHFHVAQFISYLRLLGMAPNTIISYISAIGYVHKIKGVTDPTSTTLVQKLICATVRVNPKNDNRLPITDILLIRMVQSLNSVISVPYYRALFRAMFAVAFFGLMRIGEITKTNQGQNVLQLGQVKISKDKVVITITKFKHNNGNPMDILLGAHDQKDICPVKAIHQYLSFRGGHVGPLFCFPDGNPVTREFFVKRLTACVKFCGMDAARYKTHSFRIGSASYYASMGYSDSQIRILGRWKSDAFKRYIRCQRIQNK
jgi:hypothetical protein